MTTHALRGRTRYPGKVDERVLGFQPTNIAGLQLWIDFSDASTLFTDAGTTPVSSDGDAIYQANDKSGNSRHLTQVTLANRPLYKTFIKNGLSISRFDGINDYLLRSDALGFTGNPDINIYIVCNPTTADGNSRMVSLGDNGASNAGKIVSIASDASFRYNNGYYLFGDVTMTGGFSISSWYNPASGTYGDGELIFNNSVETATGSSNPTNTVTLENDSTLVGGYYSNSPTPEEILNYYLGDIAEIIIYDTDQSENASLWSYLNKKWAIY
jgi:hypothetical protein